MTLTADLLRVALPLLALVLSIAGFFASYFAGDAAGYRRGLLHGRRRGALAVRRFRRGRRRLLAGARLSGLRSGVGIQNTLAGAACLRGDPSRN